jgi:RNA polymerase primary sigma factor
VPAADAPGDDGVRLDLQAADPAEPVEAELEAREQIGSVRDRLDRLDPRERLVLGLRFGLDGREPLTLREVGDRLGITREWARKIELRAVEKLGEQGPSPAPAPARRPRARTA